MLRVALCIERLGGENPQLAGTMQTTGDDYDKILRAYLAYDIVPKKLADEMERDYIDGPVKVANSSATLTKLLGHYSMCNYFECIPPKLGDFTAACKKEAGPLLYVDASSTDPNRHPTILASAWR